MQQMGGGARGGVVSEMRDPLRLAFGAREKARCHVVVSGDNRGTTTPSRSWGEGGVGYKR